MPIAFWFDGVLNKQQLFGNKLRQPNGSKETERSSRLVSGDLRREERKSKEGWREGGSGGTCEEALK